MVEAATRGIVDFRQAKFFDPAWRCRLRYLLSGLQSLKYQEELKFTHSYYISLLGVPKLTQEMYSDLFDMLDDLHRRMEQNLRPWDTPVSQEARKDAESRKLTTLWEQKWGKFDDPETQRKIARTAAGLRKQREANAQEISPEDILSDPKKRAQARARTGKPRRTRNDAIGRNLRAAKLRRP